jgi:hypothetical protein
MRILWHTTLSAADAEPERRAWWQRMLGGKSGEAA